MSDKPVYQYQTDGMLSNDWQDIDEQSFAKLSNDHCYTTRIVYPSAAYEALNKDRDMYKAVCEQWIEKTEWVQQDKSNLFFGSSGLHRADAMTKAIEAQRNEVERLKAENEAQAKRIAELEATLENIADSKPRLMQSDFGHEFFCYQYNPTEKARKALFASKFSSASERSDKSKN